MVKLRIVGTFVMVIPPPELPLAELEAVLDPELDPLVLEPLDPLVDDPLPLLELLLAESMALAAAFLAFDAEVTDFEVEAVIESEAAAVVVGADEPDCVGVARVVLPEVEPPTSPTSASTWHRTVVLEALSTVPVSTTITVRGAAMTSNVSSARGGVCQSRVGLKPARQARTPVPSTAAPTRLINTRCGREPRPVGALDDGGVIEVKSRAMSSPRSLG